MTALTVRPAGYGAAAPGTPRDDAGDHRVNGREAPILVDLFPKAVAACAPVDVAVGRDFDIVVLPAPAVRRVLTFLAHIRPHPVGAVIALDDQWVLIVQPDSGQDMTWPSPADHRDSGQLSVPSLSAGPADSPRWARLGNEEGRVFTAALPLYGALLRLAQPGPQPGTCDVDRVRTPVRI